MSLQSIITDLASEGGIRINDETQLQLIKYRINKAAEELYNQDDLIGSLREQVFNVNTDGEGMQITMPNYVGKIRAVRWYYPSVNLNMVDMRPKYAARFWQPKNFISWRLKGESPIQVDISNAALITVTFKAACEKAINVTIEGTTDNATGLTKETLAFAIGDLTKTTTMSFETITALTKDVPSLYDCEVLDVDDNVLATIPNNQLNTSYQWVQIMNLPNNTNGGNQTAFNLPTSYVEVLWKQKFRPFINLSDEFLCPNVYDQAIIWMYKKQRAMSAAESDPNQFIVAKGMQTQCDKIIANVANDADQNLEKYLNFGPNQYYSAFENIQSNGYPLSMTPSGGGCGLVWP